MNINDIQTPNTKKVKEYVVNCVAQQKLKPAIL